MHLTEFFPLNERTKMAKFRFYLLDLDDGSVHGTDDEAETEQAQLTENWVVLNAENGTVLTKWEGARSEVQEVEPLSSF